jgi:uncharacterized protein (TIGR02265 family)
MAGIKGSVLQSRLTFVEKELGAAVVERLLTLLAPGDREELRHLLASRWYPFDLGSRLDEAIARVAGQSRQEIFRKLGRASADANLGGPHRAFLRRNDPLGFLENTEVLYPFYYQTGRRTFEVKGPAEGVLTTFDAETYSTADCLTVCGWYERALELCGATEARVEETQCRARGDEVCRYHLRWTPPAA